MVKNQQQQQQQKKLAAAVSIYKHFKIKIDRIFNYIVNNFIFYIKLVKFVFSYFIIKLIYSTKK